MKLYFHPGSSNARKPRITAALLNLDLELSLVDVGTGAHKQPDYLAKNPNGMLPTLDDEGFVLWEANAICQYLAAGKGGSQLFPTEAKARARVVQWQFWDLAHWNTSVQPIVFERVFKKVFNMGPPDAAAVEKALVSFHRFAAVLDGQLEAREFVTEGRITLADVSLGATLTHARMAEVPLGDYKNVQRWLSGLEKLQAWKSTAPPFG